MRSYFLSKVDEFAMLQLVRQKLSIVHIELKPSIFLNINQNGLSSSKKQMKK